MSEAKLTISLPEQTWIGDVSREFPDARFRILAGIPGEDTGVALAEIDAPDLGPVFDAMRADDTLVSIDILRVHDDQALVQLETSLPLLLLASSQSGLPPGMPFDIVDGEATWELVASRDRISELGARFDGLGVAYDIEYIREQTDPTHLLTERQADLVRAAVAHGYYDTPRTCTLTELAETEGMAKSTVSEVLHRAEGTVMKQFVDAALDEGGE